MSRRLILDPDAEQDLDNLFDYIAERNPTAAARYVRELRERCAFYAESSFILILLVDTAGELSRTAQNL